MCIRDSKQTDYKKPEPDYDRAIWCGSPMFWSNAHNNCWTNYWWKPWLDGWLFKNYKRLLILGVGDMNGPVLASPDGYQKAIRTIRTRCWGLYTRNEVAKNVPVCACPSVFCLMDATEPQTLK